MEVKSINFQDCEALSRALRTERISRERFSLDIPLRDAANGLYAAMKSVVLNRNASARFRFDEETREQVMAVARWLTEPTLPPGLMLNGLFGNGKTTMARALQVLIQYVSERELGYSQRKKVHFTTAKEICSLCAASEKFKTQFEEYRQLPGKEMLIIDDLGHEPADVVVFGMAHTPLVDLLTKRYEQQRATIVTTNLNTDELKAKYGLRVYDRMREMLHPVTFTNDSFR